MRINGLIKTSLIDYKGHVASTIFTGGCNFACPYCHNGDLVLHSKHMPTIPLEEIFDHLNKRRHVLDGVCITGGEASLQDALIDFIKEVKSLDLKVKLDTNGYKPDVLEKLVHEGLLDYIAMDVKNSKEKYALTCGLKHMDYRLIHSSINLIKDSHIPHEFRTTVVKEFHEEKDLMAIATEIEGCQAFYMQQYKPCSKQIGSNMHSYNIEVLKEWMHKLTPLLNKVGIRGI